MPFVEMCAPSEIQAAERRPTLLAIPGDMLTAKLASVAVVPGGPAAAYEDSRGRWCGGAGYGPPPAVSMASEPPVGIVAGSPPGTLALNSPGVGFGPRRIPGVNAVMWRPSQDRPLSCVGRVDR